MMDDFYIIDSLISLTFIFIIIFVELLCDFLI